PLAEPAEELELNRDRELLILAHALRRLAVEHEATVAQGPAWRPLGLLAEEAVLQPQVVVGGLVLVEEVAELAVEMRVLVVGKLDDAVLDPEGVEIIIARLMARDLDGPAVKIFAVEQADPFTVCFFRLGRSPWRQSHQGARGAEGEYEKPTSHESLRNG